MTQLRFRWQTNQPWVLDIPSFTLAAGERLFLAGPSGSGKSTLLSLIIRQAFDPVWVTGQLAVQRTDTELAKAGYTLTATEVSPYDGK